ncbi:MAG: insulinase family protein [Spirochaetaceae bacterium]|jgi:Zn-dependent M16 (insulinase) family peptidase|nr:insulinase family protein [Spirochaetaceae bacterium]
MNTSLRIGQVLDSGFEILDIVELKELDAIGIQARHLQSGAGVFHVLNDDPENLFAFIFATPPEDSTGTPHVLEHAVLCGSTRYPLKDAFLVLAQGSLQTFLNAWTFPDRTLYPASSVHEGDYFNLMSVYGDAVFRPLLSEWTFMQEGRRFELLPPEGQKNPEGQEKPEQLSVTGVVYNEMKGAYSSLETYAGFWSVASVLPGTPYACESGGDPEWIPDLTWETLREFHRTHYSPANCRIFLAGNISTEKQLRFLDERFLGVLPPGTFLPPIPRAVPWEKPRRLQIPCPGGAEEKSMVFLSWLCSDSTDTKMAIDLIALTDILLGHDGSPLTRALLESGLGEDLAPCTGFEAELRETVFTAGLRSVEGGAADAVEALILGELRRLAVEGIPPEEIEAALLSLEFSNREIRRSGGPWSLVWMRRSLRGWFYGGKPWDSLLFLPSFNELKGRLAADKRYFEKLIQKWLLDNPHRALVILKPEPDYLEKKEAALEERLAQREAGLSAEERRLLREKTAELARIQSAGDSADALATIPHLSRQDLCRDIEIIPRKLCDAAGIPVLTHALYTNGISYVDLAFPLDILLPEDYPWLPLFARALVSVGLPGMDYAEVSSLLARRTGGFHGMLQCGSSIPGASLIPDGPAGIPDLRGRDWIIYRLKALDEKVGPALDLALRLITEADFQDQRRLRDLILEMKNDLNSSLAPSGHSYAAGRGVRHFSRARAVDELWNGLEQLCFIHHVARQDIAGIGRKLTDLRDRIAAGGLIVNLTGQAEVLAADLRGIQDRWRSFGAPRSRNPASRDSTPFLNLTGDPLADIFSTDLSGAFPLPPAEVYGSPSLQVGFAALVLPGAPLIEKEHAAELVLAHQLSTGALWEDIRMKGGAYGAFAYPDGMEQSFALSTYRDPNPLRSLDSFAAVLRVRAEQEGDEEALEKAVIGAYARETRPRTAADRGLTDFFRFLYGINDRHREQKLHALIDVSEGEITGAAGRLAGKTTLQVASEGFPEGWMPLPVIIAGMETARTAAARLGVCVRELPV